MKEWKTWQLSLFSTILLWGVILGQGITGQDAEAEELVVEAGFWSKLKGYGEAAVDFLYGTCKDGGVVRDHRTSDCEPSIWGRAEDVASATTDYIVDTATGTQQYAEAADQINTVADLCAERGGVLTNDPNAPCQITDYAKYCHVAEKGATWNGQRCVGPNETPVQTEKLDCLALIGSGFHWDTRQNECFPSMEHAWLDYCSDQDKIHVGQGICFTFEQKRCAESSGYYVQVEDRCYPTRDHYRAAQCETEGKVWYGSCMTYQEYTTKQEEIGCQQRGEYWRDGQCYVSEEAYDAEQCDAQGKFYYDGRCLTEVVYLEAVCDDANGLWKGALFPAEEYPCFEDKEAYDSWVCSQDGLVLFRGACEDIETVRQETCVEEAGVYIVDQGCYKAIDVHGLCSNAGYLFDATTDRCLVLSDDAIPEGLEKFFLSVTEAQYEVVAGDYAFWVDNQLAGLSKNYVSVDDLDFKEILTLVDEARARIQKDTVEEMADATIEYVPDLEAYQALLEREDRILGELDVVERILEERAKASAYQASPEPGASLQVLKRTLTGSWPEVTIQYPAGFPTPKLSQGAYHASVPVRVNEPTVRHPFLEATYEVFGIYYEVSLDDGSTWHAGYVEVEPGVENYEVQFSWPAEASKYQLKFRARAEFVETLVYRESDIEWAAEGIRAGPVLERPFFTSSNPFQTAAVQQSNVEHEGYQQSEAPEQNGSEPGGVARAYNDASYQYAKANAQAAQVDQAKGLGLALLFKALPWLMGAMGIYLAYAKGYVDWVPGVQNLKQKIASRKAAKQDTLDLNLGDDLLEGI